MVYKKKLKAIKAAVEKVRENTLEPCFGGEEVKMTYMNEIYEIFFNEVVNELEGLEL